MLRSKSKRVGRTGGPNYLPGRAGPGLHCAGCLGSTWAITDSTEAMVDGLMLQAAVDRGKLITQSSMQSLALPQLLTELQSDSRLITHNQKQQLAKLQRACEV